MSDQAICQECLASQTKPLQQQAQVSEVTLWRQLEPQHQIQLAQRWAELIQRIRKAACLEKNSDEGV